jgi:hypothetical protein
MRISSIAPYLYGDYKRSKIWSRWVQQDDDDELTTTTTTLHLHPSTRLTPTTIIRLYRMILEAIPKCWEPRNQR